MGIIKYSYSRVDTYGKCPWKYKLKYIDLHYTESSTLALELGTLVHYIEEHISYALMKGEEPDYDALREEFYNINKVSAYLQIPYLLWLIFAAILNFGIYLLN